MAKINSLSLYHFKNYTEFSIQFDKNIVCIIGKNGVGKTTILDAIYYLCFTKSYFTSSDLLCIKQGEKGMFIKGIFGNEKKMEIKCTIRENGKKEFSVDEEIYSKLANHIGKISSVMIAPDDTQLITEGSEFRRKYIDGIIAQIDAGYLQNLTNYSKVLVQRNAYLKSCQGRIPSDLSLISLYNLQLDEFAKKIVSQRIKYVEILNKICQKIYAIISNDHELIEIEYESKLINNSLQNLLENNLQKDIITARTNYGIHKDDLIFYMNDMFFKQVASQGQRKSFLFGLKLAQFDILSNQLTQKPLLLFDDIFEKLDEHRSEKLIEYIVNLNTQLFITDTHESRINIEFEKYNSSIQLIKLN